jgi:hypothetical protein
VVVKRESGEKLQIPYELKRRCVELSKTDTARHIYDTAFLPEHDGMGFETFRRKLQQWKKHTMADDDTLNAGTYAGFATHDATVQVDGAGNIRQAWIKQSSGDVDWQEVISTIKEATRPIEVKPSADEPEKAMLEIPLFDMHFGIAKLSDYIETYGKIIREIQSKVWAEINIIIGQDLIHNNDMRGHTAKGTCIEQIDVPRAWADAKAFWSGVIESAVEHADKVNIMYSVGNHDECQAWAFTQMIKAMFPQTSVDDSLKPRKCISWEECFIGIGHCEYTNKAADLFQDFVLDFPAEFAGATVREIHTGHLHRESIDNGTMVRRLASGVPTDAWNSKNGFTGVNKRFQLFEWEPGALAGIKYV